MPTDSKSTPHSTPVAEPPVLKPDVVHHRHRRRASRDDFSIDNSTVQWMAIAAALGVSGLALWKIFDFMKNPPIPPNGHPIEEPVEGGESSIDTTTNQNAGGEIPVVDIQHPETETQPPEQPAMGFTNPGRASVTFTTPSEQGPSDPRLDLRFQTSYDKPPGMNHQTSQGPAHKNSILAPQQTTGNPNPDEIPDRNNNVNSIPPSIGMAGYAPANNAVMDDIKDQIRKKGIKGRFMGSFMRSS